MCKYNPVNSKSQISSLRVRFLESQFMLCIYIYTSQKRTLTFCQMEGDLVKGVSDKGVWGEGRAERTKGLKNRILLLLPNRIWYELQRYWCTAVTVNPAQLQWRENQEPALLLRSHSLQANASAAWESGPRKPTFPSSRLLVFLMYPTAVPTRS